MLDREDFRLWLAAKEPDEYAGEAKLAMGCPLSTYLWEWFGLRGSVGWLEFLPLPLGAPAVLLPEWARSFVVSVDFTREKGTVVTAKEALTLLDCIGVDS